MSKYDLGVNLIENAKTSTLKTIKHWIIISKIYKKTRQSPI